MRLDVVLSIACLLLTGTGLARAGPVTSKPDPARGKQLAESLCAGCHLVASGQEHANVDVPSFFEIAGKSGQTEGAHGAYRPAEAPNADNSSHQERTCRPRRLYNESA